MQSINIKLRPKIIPAFPVTRPTVIFVADPLFRHKGKTKQNELVK